MISVYSGVSRFALRYVVTNFLSLLKVSAIPFAIDAQRPASKDISALARNAALGQLAMSVLFLPVNWYFLALFADSYRRLSTTP